MCSRAASQRDQEGTTEPKGFSLHCFGVSASATKLVQDKMTEFVSKVQPMLIPRASSAQTDDWATRWEVRPIACAIV